MFFWRIWFIRNIICDIILMEEMIDAFSLGVHSIRIFYKNLSLQTEKLWFYYVDVDGLFWMFDHGRFFWKPIRKNGHAAGAQEDYNTIASPRRNFNTFSFFLRFPFIFLFLFFVLFFALFSFRLALFFFHFPILYRFLFRLLYFPPPIK